MPSNIVPTDVQLRGSSLLANEDDDELAPLVICARTNCMPMIGMLMPTINANTPVYKRCKSAVTGCPLFAGVVRLEEGMD
jgi:hypothetical protein